MAWMGSSRLVVWEADMEAGRVEVGLMDGRSAASGPERGHMDWSVETWVGVEWGVEGEERLSRHYGEAHSFDTGKLGRHAGGRGKCDRHGRLGRKLRDARS